MKTKTTLILGTIAIGVVLMLQSWTGSNTELNTAHGTNISTPINDLMIKEPVGFETMLREQSKGDTTRKLEEIGDSRTDQSSIELLPSEGGCTVPTGSFTDTLDINVFIISGTQLRQSIDVSITESELGSPNRVYSSPTGLQYCATNEVKSVMLDTNRSHSPGVSASFTDENKSSIDFIIKPNHNTTNGEATPVITAYTKTDSDTLYILMSYSSHLMDTTFSFNVESNLSKVVVYSLNDDPKTTRGTVTTVQSHSGNYYRREERR